MSLRGNLSMIFFSPMEAAENLKRCERVIRRSSYRRNKPPAVENKRELMIREIDNVAHGFETMTLAEHVGDPELPEELCWKYIGVECPPLPVDSESEPDEEMQQEWSKVMGKLGDATGAKKTPKKRAKQHKGNLKRSLPNRKHGGQGSLRTTSFRSQVSSVRESDMESEYSVFSTMSRPENQPERGVSPNDSERKLRMSKSTPASPGPFSLARSFPMTEKRRNVSETFNHAGEDVDAVDSGSEADSEEQDGTPKKKLLFKVLS